MRRVLIALAALGAVVVMAVPAQAGGPPFQAGPKHGDEFTSTSADPNTGEVQIFNLNIRQPSAVHCVGDGPYASLQTTQPADGVHSVSVAYKDGTWQDTVVMDINIIGSRSGVLGHGEVLGGTSPKFGQSGTVTMTLFSAPQPGEMLTTRFGLQAHQGCLPGAQPVGLNGSRPVEWGRVTFVSVTTG